MTEATAMRGKEAAAFGAMEAEASSNIAATTKAVAALEKGSRNEMKASDSTDEVTNSREWHPLSPRKAQSD